MRSRIPNKRCYLVQVNEASVKNLHNVHSELVKKLEENFSTPVVIVPFRNKINGIFLENIEEQKFPEIKL